MKKIIFILIAFLSFNKGYTQELNAQVNILLPQQVQSPPELFATMKTTIIEFINGRKWSRDNWNNNEKIEEQQRED